MLGPNDPYEQRLRSQIAAASKLLRNIYEQSIIELSLKASKINFQGEVFDLSKFPALKKQMERVIARMHGDIYTLIVNGTKDSWDLSNEKNNRLVDRRLAGRNLSARVRRILYDPNKGALDSFITRKEKGLNLSDRIWGALETHRNDLERSLGLGISNGESAAEMAREQKKYLDDPDRLYRRVRDESGKLKLSKPAKEFRPGQGVYRSSFKNAYRLTRSETNTAYRKSDFERWQSLPFVVGVEIKLSDSHPKYDICDNLAGKYPKWFNWTGWHPQCICFAVPIMMTDEEFSKLQDSQLGLGEFDGKSINEVKEMPEAFTKYVQDNIDRIDGWKNRPYWVQDNPEFIKGALQSRKVKQKAQPGPVGFEPGGNPIRPQFTNIQKGIVPRVRESLSIIDSVHGDGTLANIPFTQSRTKAYKAAFYSNILGTPIRIDLANGNNSHEFSLVHEMGHYFDLHAIGSPGSFASAKQDLLLAPVLAAAQKSSAIRDIRKTYQERKVIVDEKEFPLSPNGKKFLEYLLNPKEIWARAYTQFIANRSGNKRMQATLQATQLSGKQSGYMSQWDDNDFAKIEKEIESLMLELGWINQL